MKTLKIILIISSLFCFTGVPWLFVPWNNLMPLLEYLYKVDIPCQSIDIFIFKIECFLFLFFSIYFILLYRNLNRYRKIIYLVALLILIMGNIMYFLKSITQIGGVLSIWEPIFWIVISVIILYLNYNYNKEQEKKVENSCPMFYLVSITNFSFIIFLLFPKFTWNVLLSMPIDYEYLSSFTKYNYYMTVSFISLTSIIIHQLGNINDNYNALKRLIILFEIITPIFILSLMLFYKIPIFPLSLALIVMELEGILLLIKNRSIPWRIIENM